MRHGENIRLQDPRGERPSHTRLRVYQEMMLNVAMHYRSAPDVRTMDLEELEFFYEGLRGHLMSITKPGE